MALLDNIFPSEKDIPEQWQLTGFIEQREYLVDGELRTWDGPVNEIVSPVSVNGTKYSIGSTPLLTEKESLEALDAAVRAYNSGTGEWPTMSVTQRIEHVEKFLSAKGDKFELVEQKTLLPTEGFDGFYMASLKKK